MRYSWHQTTRPSRSTSLAAESGSEFHSEPEIVSAALVMGWEECSLQETAISNSLRLLRIPY